MRPLVNSTPLAQATSQVICVCVCFGHVSTHCSYYNGLLIYVGLFLPSLSYNIYVFCRFYYSICHESVCKTSENHAPSPAVTEEAEVIDDIMKTTSPMNEETIEHAQGQETSVPYVESDPKSVGTTTNVTETKESNKENDLKDSTEKAITETSTNKPATASKNKTSRDKNGGGMAGSRVTSKSQISDSGGNSVGTSRKPTSNSQASLAGNYILEPDPKVKITLTMLCLLGIL